jgi:hypothetical protein
VEGGLAKKPALLQVFCDLSEAQRCRASRRDREPGSRKFASGGEQIICDYIIGRYEFASVGEQIICDYIIGRYEFASGGEQIICDDKSHVIIILIT